jgi:hypothetical protein
MKGAKVFTSPNEQARALHDLSGHQNYRKTMYMTERPPVRNKNRPGGQDTYGVKELNISIPCEGFV